MGSWVTGEKVVSVGCKAMYSKRRRVAGCFHVPHTWGVSHKEEGDQTTKGGTCEGAWKAPSWALGGSACTHKGRVEGGRKGPPLTPIGE